VRMMAMSPRTLLAGLIPLVTAALAAAAAPPVPHVDSLGDPLPPGALARLGTLRFHLPCAATAVALSPDGKLAATAADADAYLWEMRGRKPRRVLRAHKDAVHLLAFSPDGKALASGDRSAEGEVRVWDVSTGESRRITVECASLAFAPDGRSVAVLVRK